METDRVKHQFEELGLNEQDVFIEEGELEED